MCVATASKICGGVLMYSWYALLSHRPRVYTSADVTDIQLRPRCAVEAQCLRRVVRPPKYSYSLPN